MQGAFDPDAADIEIALIAGRRTVATHTQTDWLLRIDPTGPYCDYLVALLVLLDDEGGLLEPAGFPEVTGDDVVVEATLRSPLGEATGRFPVRLLVPVDE